MALQHDALTAAGCYRSYIDIASGALAERPQLAEVLDQLRPGDILVVWRLDRIGRSLRHLVDTVAALGERGIGVRSVRESIDTTTPGGRASLRAARVLNASQGTGPAGSRRSVDLAVGSAAGSDRLERLIQQVGEVDILTVAEPALQGDGQALEGCSDAGAQRQWAESPSALSSR